MEMNIKSRAWHCRIALINTDFKRNTTKLQRTLYFIKCVLIHYLKII